MHTYKRIILAALLALVFAVPAQADHNRNSGVSSFWMAVHNCEQPNSWHIRGPTYEGGLGIYAPNWVTWTKDLGLYDQYPHAYMAPPDVQAKVAHFGFKVWTDGNGQHAGWGCINRYGFGWLAGA